MKVPEYLVKTQNPVADAASTPTQSYVSGASLLGGAPSLSMAKANEPEVNNKDSNLGIIGRGLSVLPSSIGKGVTQALDKISDAPSYVGKFIGDDTASKTGLHTDYVKAKAATDKYTQHRDTHLLGTGVSNWEQSVAGKQEAIVSDNPNSKLAENVYKGTKLAESVGEMLPTVAVSAAVGGLGVAAAGGKEALALAGTSAAKAAALGTAGKVGELAGLGVMAMDVYSRSVDESTAQGYDFATSSKKAFGDAALEVGTEMLFGGIAGLGEGVVSQVSKNIVNRSITKAAASEGAEQLIKMTGVEKAILSVAKAANRVSAMMESTAFTRLASNAFGEAAEEMISEFLGPYIERMTTNPNASKASIDQIIEAGIGGAIISFAMAPLGKLQTMVGTPDADVVEKARLVYKLQDYDQNVRMMKDLIYDSVAGEDLTAVEEQMGRELVRVSDGDLAKGLGASYHRKALRILNDLEASGHTALDVSNAWESLRVLYDQVSAERSDEAAAKIYNDETKNRIIDEDESVKKAQADVDRTKTAYDTALAIYEEAVNDTTGFQDVDTARKARAETERAYKNAQASLQKERNRAMRDAESRLSESDAVEKYGQEAVHNFQAAQRVKDIKQGRFYVTDANGNERLYTKDQYAAEKFDGKRYSQLTKEQKAEVDAVKDAYRASVRQELESYVKKINESLDQRGLGGKLRVELNKPGEGKYPALYSGGTKTIYLTAGYVQTTAAADYFLSHEFLHAVEDQFISQETAGAFHGAIREAMNTIGFDYDKWFARIGVVYDKVYRPQAEAEANRKKKTGKDKENYINRYLVKHFDEEVRARFMQTAFSSQSILQSLAVETPEVLEQARNSINDSSVAKLTDTTWDYERLMILDRINKALTAPVSAETNKKKNAEAVDMAFMEIEPDVWDSGNFYSKMEQAIEDSKQQKLGASSVISYLRGKGVKEEEIKWSGLEDFLDGKKSVTKEELLEYAKASRYPIYVRKLSGDDSRWGGYSLLGGPMSGLIPRDFNYREYLYVSGASNSNNDASKAHWGNSYLKDREDYSKGVLAHARVSDLLHNNDGDVLFIEEIQSDWHNEIEKLNRQLSLIAKDREVNEDFRRQGFLTEDEYAKKAKSLDSMENEYSQRLTEAPEAPFSNGEYVNFVLKNLLQEAAANGYDYLGWTSGKQQEARWSDQYAEGYRIEYDQDIPKFLNKFGKKFGAKAEIGLDFDRSSGASDQTAYQNLDAVTLGAEGGTIDVEIAGEFVGVVDTASVVLKAAYGDLPIYNAEDLYLSKTTTNNDYPEYDVINRQTGEIVAIVSVPPHETNYVGFYDPVSETLLYGFHDRSSAVAKSLGIKEHIDINQLSNSWLFPITEEMRKSVLEVGQPMYFEDIKDDGDSIGMTEERLRQYRELQQKYGSNEFGAPNKINSNVATSRFASRLAANKANIWSTDADGNTTMTGVNTPEELAASLHNGFLNCINTHIVMTDEAAIAEARSRISMHKEKTYNKDGKVAKEKTVQHKTLNDAFVYAKGMLTSGKVLNKNDLAFAQQLIVEMANQYGEIIKGSDRVQAIESKNTEELFNQLQELVADTCAAATRAGQNLQAFALLKKMTPTGRLYYIESQAKQLISELVDRRGQSRVSGFLFEKDSKGNVKLDENNKPKRIVISEELRQKMYECTTQEEMDAVEEEIIAEIASKIDPSLMDRVTAWRYLSMLGNPRTHVRNIVSNFTMGATVKAKNRVGGALEDIFLKDKTQGRTKTLKAIDPEIRKSLMDFAENDWANDGMNDVALSGGKVGFQNRINEARKKMKMDLLDRAAKKNGVLLEIEDDRAGKRAYKEAFVRYAAANNLSVDYLSAGTVESNVALAQARSYAVNEAAKATYHDASKVATMLNELEHMDGGKGAAAKLLIGGIAPFKKTPINILSRGVEYSPIGLVDGLVKTFKAWQSTTEDIFEVDGKKVTRSEYESKYGGKGGKFVKASDYQGEYSATTSADALDLDKSGARMAADAKRTKAIADAIDELAAGLTGTGLLIVGVLLAQLGLMKGSGDDDNKDAEYYEQMLGNQEYSITIGNKNYTLDWLTPVSMPLFAGVELHKAKVDGGEMSFEELVDAIGRVADPITNLSLLQGVNDAMSEYDSGLYSFARSAAESFAGQFVPTAFGQVARSIDPTRRTTYAPKDSAAGKKAATFINKMENKIPVLSKTNAAYVDQWGRTETNNGDTFIERLFMNSVAPMYVRTVNKTEADDYISQLFAQTGSNSIIPKSPESSYTIDGDTFYLTSQEYQQTKELVGQLSHVGVTSLLSVPGFADLSADDQADLVSDVYSFAKRVAKEDYANANGIEMAADSTNTKIKNAVLAGMSIGEAVYVYKMANLVEGVKNAKGNTISGSKKANLLSFYRTMGLTNDQINALKPSNYDFGL